MNKVEISSSSKPPPELASAGRLKSNAKKFLLKVLKKLKEDNREVSVLFCDDGFIKKLNGEYRGKDEPTDILSFPRDGGCGGDIAISLDTLVSNAKEFNLSADEELKRLLIHGVLHLAGFDHKAHCLTAESIAAEPMFEIQERLMRELTNETITGRVNV